MQLPGAKACLRVGTRPVLLTQRQLWKSETAFSTQHTILCTFPECADNLWRERCLNSGSSRTFPSSAFFLQPLGSLSHFILSWSPRPPLFVCGLLRGWTPVLSPFGSAAGKGCEVQTPEAEMEEETPPTTAPSPAVVVV